MHCIEINLHIVLARMLQKLCIWLSLLPVWISFANYSAPVFSQTQAYQRCDFTLSVNSSMTLQQAITYVLSRHSAGTNCVQINVPSGKYNLTSQILFPSEVGQIEFAGLGSNVNVFCAYTVESNYTWYFDHLSFVTIRGIHFENCPRPLRLDTISNVTIHNCSFR